MAKPEHLMLPTGAVCPSGSLLDYASFGRDFMARHCVNCHNARAAGPKRHGAPADHNFDTVEGIRAERAHIDAVAAAGPWGTRIDMPPVVPAPATAARAQLGEWLACGAP